MFSFFKSKPPVILKYKIGHFKDYNNISKEFKNFLWALGYNKCIYCDNPDKIEVSPVETFKLCPINYDIAVKAHEKDVKVVEFVWELLTKDKYKAKYKNFASDSYSDYLDRLSKSMKKSNDEFFYRSH